ncbi:3-hydroxy-3-methylglutaryl-coenzyme A reductase-like [Cimex lectularius]|uniref:3-hydroxy-3-methylglutaryl coenzyme A reductase n=1 Tax=Cimex lectularius TaxID=79782 RepID=A0A8I6RDZ4_CIMLE|nr:3-hydroxy-3-methylglutaryl-coenzyme A reductase-like [Cimex lectularius]
MFKKHGQFCANHPWEVIVATLTLTSCLFTMDFTSVAPRPKPELSHDSLHVDVAIMTSVRCIAILYCYYKFRSLRSLGSTFLGVAGVFTVISSFVFSSTVINCFGGDISDLKDALFCFLLLIDLSKATLLAQFALSASDKEEVKKNIARGLDVLGPGLTLDALVETLLISVGTLSGIRKLETLCFFACVSVIVNYIVFMTFYPACLSLVLELYDGLEKVPWEMVGESEKQNPVLQRVKVIMSAGLMIVHLQNRWSLTGDERENSTLPISEVTSTHTIDTLKSTLLGLSVDQVVVFILLLALTIKFIFFEGLEFIQSSHEDTKNEMVEYEEPEEDEEMRPIEECLTLMRTSGNLDSLRDNEVNKLIEIGEVKTHSLELQLNNKTRAVKIRRMHLSKNSQLKNAFMSLPYERFDYKKVFGACCENVIGYVPLPLGIVGPLLLDGKKVYIPMATTEGCLVASTNRGCRAVSFNGVTSRSVDDGMTRGPVVRFPDLVRASEAMTWIKSEEAFKNIKKTFDSTSRFAKLTKIQVRITGRLLFIRFVATTGDAMGMNMVSKGSEHSLIYIKKKFQDMEILSLSGNYCADKKSTSVNWIEGRGKSVVCEARISSNIVKTVLKTSVEAIVDLNINKNLVGSAVAGSIGGFNAHAANIVTAIFIATGQDPAQNVTSSQCMTLMEPCGNDNSDLYISCTMPCIEVGTLGGGTVLSPQSSCLEILGVKGSSVNPGDNASRLARIVCACVLAGELSLMAALASGDLVKSHLKHNRSSTSVTSK